MPKMTMDEIRTLSNNVKTVGDLMDRLATLPRDMPLMQRGSGGNFNQGAEARVVETFSRHQNEEDFIGDMSDRVWRQTRRAGFGEQFSGFLID